MMDTKEDTDSPEDKPSSPYALLQQLSEDAFKVAGEALQSFRGYSGSPDLQSMQAAHRRCQSESFAAGNLRSNSLSRLKTHVQKAWRWGSNVGEQGFMPHFNPEILANHKRQWYQLHSKTSERRKYKEPKSLFEHFVIVGLHPDTNLEAVEETYARKKWELTKTKSTQRIGPSYPTLEPQILFKYPPGKRLAIRMKDLAAFCLPEGVKTRLLQRTPSLTELNELVYGQEHLGRDDLSFIFSLKVADDTVYGVCLHVSEIVQRPPCILGASLPLSQSSGRFSRFLVSAPRCYCVLTRVPFFELHYEMLNSIIAQERLNRITQFVNEISLASYSPLAPKQPNQMGENLYYTDNDHGGDYLASAIPVDSAMALTAAAAGIITDGEIPTLSPRVWEPHSPESVTTASESSDCGQTREIDKDSRKFLNCFDDSASESMEIRSDALERICGHYNNGLASPEMVALSCPKSGKLEQFGSFDTLFSPVRSVTSEEDDELSANSGKDFEDGIIMEWARENKNDLLQMLCAYHAMPLPIRGSEIVFQPLEHLRAIEYRRASVSDLGFSENCLDSFEHAEVNAKLAVAEEAVALSVWTTATICRVLSLRSVLALVTGVLLEKQVVIICPNLGVLSAVVSSIVPMIRPFQWQSLLLPILPGKMIEFLDAPVPFIVGVQHKPADLKLKPSNVMQVNVLKDQVIMSCLPALPCYKELVTELGPIHARLSLECSVAEKQPVYRCNEVQAEAATQFLSVMRRYLESLCSNLWAHTITSVQSNNDRVSLLLKDSYIDSFPSRERLFVRPFVDTQLFTVLSDSRLSTFENGPFDVKPLSSSCFRKKSPGARHACF